MGAKNKIFIAATNKLSVLTLPAHLQLNCGKAVDPTHRDALRAKIIRSAYAPAITHIEGNARAAGNFNFSGCAARPLPSSATKLDRRRDNVTIKY